MLVIDIVYPAKFGLRVVSLGKSIDLINNINMVNINRLMGCGLHAF